MVLIVLCLILLNVLYSTALLDVDTPNCRELYEYLNNDESNKLFRENLDNMKTMMAASQYSGNNQTQEMDTTGVLLLFKCLEENVDSNMFIKVPTDLDAIIQEMFIVPYQRTFEKYTQFSIQLLDENGVIELNVTCATKKSIVKKEPLKLLCDFGNIRGEVAQLTKKRKPLTDQLFLLD